MKKKVGILTFIQSMNYGARLQAYALQTVIVTLGFDCELINFKRPQDQRITEGLRHLKQGKIGQGTRALLFECMSIQKTIRFNSFTKKNIKLSPATCFHINDLATIAERYDSIICGSDQVWNPELTQESQLCYLLDFITDSNIRRISYAASLGNDSFDKSWELDFSRCLKKYDAISIREKSASALIEKLSGKEVTAVLDPTLLLKKEKWEVVKKDLDIKEPFLLVYAFGYPENLKRTAEHIAQKKGLKIITLHKRKHYQNELCRYPYAGPREFLGLFAKADFVVTNSFHGTAFSLIYQKPFYSVISNNRSARIKDLLTDLGLSCRLIDKDEDIKDMTVNDIDFVMVENKLSALREKSINFLIKSLNNN